MCLLNIQLWRYLIRNITRWVSLNLLKGFLALTTFFWLFQYFPKCQSISKEIKIFVEMRAWLKKWAIINKRVKRLWFNFRFRLATRVDDDKLKWFFITNSKPKYYSSINPGQTRPNIFLVDLNNCTQI